MYLYSLEKSMRKLYESFFEKNNFEFYTVIYGKEGILTQVYSLKTVRPLGWYSGHFRVNVVLSWSDFVSMTVSR